MLGAYSLTLAAKGTLGFFKLCLIPTHPPSHALSLRDFHVSKRQPRNVFIVKEYVRGKEGAHAFLKLTQEIDTKFVISGVEGGLVLIAFPYGRTMTVVR